MQHLDPLDDYATKADWATTMRQLDTVQASTSQHAEGSLKDCVMEAPQPLRRGAPQMR